MPYSVAQVMSCTLGSPGNATEKKSVRLVYVVHSCEKEGHETSSINAAALSQIRRMIDPPKPAYVALILPEKQTLRTNFPVLRNRPVEPRYCRPNRRRVPLCLSKTPEDNRWTHRGGDGIWL